MDVRRARARRNGAHRDATGRSAARCARTPRRRRSEPGAARPEHRALPRHRRSHAAARRPGGLRARARLRPGHLLAAQEHGGSRVDAGDLGADLRDLQDVPAAAGQVPADSRAVHRRHHRRVLRAPAALLGLEGRHHPGLQPGRHRRQLRRRVVRHPREHLRQLPDRLRQPARQALSLLRDPAQGRHEHRHDAHQRRAAADAVHPAVHPRRLRGPLLHRLRDWRIAGRGRAPHRGRHLHEDRRHRGGPDEDRLQDQGRRCAQPRRHRGLHGRQRGRLGGPLGRRVRDLRRHRRRADLVHPARRQQPDDADPAAGLDLHDAHRHGGGLRRLVPGERGDSQGAVRQRRPHGLRGAR